MRSPIFQGSHPLTKIVFLVAITLVSSLFLILVGILLSVALFGIDLNNLNEFFDVHNSENIPFMKFMQGLQTIALFCVPALLAAFLYSISSFNYLKLTKKPSFVLFIISGLLVFTALPLINISGFLNSLLELPDAFGGLEQSMLEMEETAKQTTQTFLTTGTISGLILNLFIIAVLPAICEEFLFRGILQKLFIDWFKNIHLAIIVTSLIFSFIHFQFYGFLPRVILGMLFGYLFVWSRNLWVPIFAHFINNALGVTLFYFFQGTDKFEQVGEVGVESSQIFFLIIMTFVTGVLIYVFRRESNKDKPQSIA